MPTTCGFPNCKFRSRYRGYHDNRHFYRVPKKPAVLRERWLEAIGRTEGTIVNQQLRVCSGHFHGGKKNEGDIPVADPEVDPPVHVDLPPAPPKRVDKVPKPPRRTSTDKPKKNVSGNSSSAASNAEVRTPSSSDCDFDAGIVKILSNGLPPNGPASTQSTPPLKPLVAYLDGKDCSVELGLLKDFSNVAFCDAVHAADIHDRVYKEAVAVFMFQHMRLTKETLRMFKSLRLIVKMGCNCDNIDVDAASNMGIAVSLISGFATEEVADMAFSFILNLYRQTFQLMNALKDGQKFSRLDDIFEGAKGSSRIRGECLGLIGLGRIGSAVALRARAFGFKVIFYDPYLEDGHEKSLGISRVETLKELLSLSDCISLHCTYNEQNRHMLNDVTLSYLHSGAYLVNTANGNLICEKALASALKSGIIRGAALDVHEMEPFDMQNSPLRDCPNLLCTPNAALYSEQGFVEMKHKMAEEIRRGLLGQVPRDLEYCVNKMALFRKPEEHLNTTSHIDTTGTSVISSLPSLFLPVEKLSKETSNPPCVTAQPFQPLVSSSWPSSTPFQPMVTNSWPPVYQFASPHLVDSGLLPIALPFQPMVSSGQLRISQLPLPKGESSQSYHSVARQQPFSRP